MQRSIVSPLSRPLLIEVLAFIALAMLLVIAHASVDSLMFTARHAVGYLSRQPFVDASDLRGAAASA